MTTQESSSPTRIRNRTPHDPLRIWSGEDLLIELAGDGPPSRLSEHSTPGDPIKSAAATVPTVQLTYGNVHDLPDPEPGTILIVSQLVCRALPERRDLYFPTALRRDSEGNIVGCEALARFWDTTPGGAR